MLLAANPELANVKTVYFLPMGGGLDHYMAIRLTEKQLFKVVTNPAQADAVFTDRIGEGLEDRLDELFPDDSKKPKDAEKDSNEWATQKPTRSASFSRGKGTIFLIDRKNRDVIWSIYSPSKSQRAPDVNKNATSITRKIQEQLQPPKPPKT